jgi:undecaprenyl-diphosphatase
LLSIPTFLAAAVYEWRKLSELGHLGQLDWPVMLLGAVVAGVVGYVCVRGFLHYVARHRLYGFAAYCWVMSVLMFTLFTVK